MLINITSITQMPDPWDTADKDIVQCNGITYQNIRNEFWLPVGFGAPVFTTGTLPPTTGLLEGTAVAVSDFGGNVAKLVNGQWRFELPFRTTWAGRPAVGLVPAGTELQVTDYANQKWISDGTVWRPAQGRVKLLHKWGSTSSPVSIVTGAVDMQFTLTDKIIKPGVLLDGCKLNLQAWVRRNGNAGTAYIYAKMGVLDSYLDVAMTGSSFGATDGLHYRMDLLSVVAGPSLFNMAVTAPQAASSAPSPGTANFDVAADMDLSFHIRAANPADTFSLVGYTLSMEA